MARGKSGAIRQSDGAILVGPVVLPDRRLQNLRELLIDLSRPGVCIVLGAGASHSVVPISPREIAEIALEKFRALARGSVPTLSRRQEALMASCPEVRYLTQLLQEMPPNAWDRYLVDSMTPGRATVVLNDIFTPQTEVPPALSEIYGVIENANGALISFNYDGIDQGQSRFPVIHPHGLRPSLLPDPLPGPEVRKAALFSTEIVPTDWHLPLPEKEGTRLRLEYRRMLEAWKQARAVVFVGYGFGGGMDAFSYEDFGRFLHSKARVHVLCPRPDNADLRKQIGFVLRGRNSGFCVFGQPFRWKALAEAILLTLQRNRAVHVRAAIGREGEIALAHDQR